MKEERIAVVSGATGFLGSRLVANLLSEGWIVRALSSGMGQRKGVLNKDGVHKFNLDGRDICRATSGACAYFNCSVLYERPGITNAEMLGVNVDLPLQIISNLRENGNGARAVLADSFFRKFRFDRTGQPAYTASKHRLAEQLRAWCDIHNMPIVTILVEHMYGPDDNPQKVIPRIVADLRNCVPRIALTSGFQRRDFVHVHDVAAGMVAAYWHAKPGLAEVGCGTGESVSFRDAVCLLRDICGSSSELGFGDLPNFPNEIIHSEADNSWLLSMGWKPTFDIEEGFRDLLAFEPLFCASAEAAHCAREDNGEGAFPIRSSDKPPITHDKIEQTG